MITKCTNCGELLEYGGNPGELTDCASCGQPFEVSIIKPAPQTRRIPDAQAAQYRPPIVQGKVQTELTAKKYKGQYVVFFFLIVIGIFFIAGGSDAFGGIAFFVGLIGFLATRFMAWWQHG